MILSSSNSFDPDQVCDLSSLLSQWTVIIPDSNTQLVVGSTLNISLLYFSNPSAFGSLPSCLAISLTVTCPLPFARSSSASTSFVVSPPSSLLRELSLLIQEDSLTRYFGPSGALLINRQRKLTILSRYLVDFSEIPTASLNTIDFSWFMNDTALDLSNSQIVKTSSSSPSLVLAAGVLLDNHRYTFFLNCSLVFSLLLSQSFSSSGSFSSSLLRSLRLSSFTSSAFSSTVLEESLTASLSTITYVPVSGGMCTVSPTQGVAFQTRSSFLCFMRLPFFFLVLLFYGAHVLLDSPSFAYLLVFFFSLLCLLCACFFAVS